MNYCSVRIAAARTAENGSPDRSLGECQETLNLNFITSRAKSERDKSLMKVKLSKTRWIASVSSSYTAA